MDKKKLMRLFLVLLPLMAVVLATTGDAVMVFDAAAGETVYGSYFQILSQAGSYQMLPPLAGLLAALCTVITGIWAVRGGNAMAKVMKVLCFAAVLAAVMPIALSRGPIVMPNILFPVLLAAHYVLASILTKPVSEDGSKRLS